MTNDIELNRLRSSEVYSRWLFVTWNKVKGAKKVHRKFWFEKGQKRWLHGPKPLNKTFLWEASQTHSSPISSILKAAIWLTSSPNCLSGESSYSGDISPTVGSESLFVLPENIHRKTEKEKRGRKTSKQVDRSTGMWVNITISEIFFGVHDTGRGFYAVLSLPLFLISACLYLSVGAVKLQQQYQKDR